MQIIAEAFWAINSLSFEHGVVRRLIEQHHFEKVVTGFLLKNYLEDVQSNTYEPGHLTPKLSLTNDKQNILSELFWCTGNVINDSSIF